MNYQSTKCNKKVPTLPVANTECGMAMCMQQEQTATIEGQYATWCWAVNIGECFTSICDYSHMLIYDFSLDFKLEQRANIKFSVKLKNQQWRSLKCWSRTMAMDL